MTGSLRSLRHRDFRIFWLGLIVSAIGTWMQIVAQSLLVLRLTHGSAFALGVVSLAQASAFFLFALVGGGFADRWNRRRLLLVTQSMLLCLAVGLGALTQTGLAKVWMIVLAAFLSGALLSFDQPARAALIASLVPKEDLLNAVALQSAVFNGASTLGPALAGFVIQKAGLAADFYLNGFSFLAVLLALAAIRPAKTELTKRPRFAAQIFEALQTVGRDPILPALLSAYGILLFAGPSLALLLPVLAVQRMGVDAQVLGFLFSGAGLGAVLGAIFISSLPGEGYQRPLLLSCFGVWCASLATIGFSRTVTGTFAALIGFGMAQSVIGTITSTQMQIRVPAEQRGRVMSLNTLLVMGVRPLGDFPAGMLIGLVGAPLTAGLSAIAVGLAAAGLLRRKQRTD
jgi:MFS family permease